MNFVSAIFLLFLTSVLLLFYTLPKSYRLPLLLLASYIFYATWSLPYIALIALTTSTDYWFSGIINRSNSGRTRKVALCCGLLINLLILGFFKYFSFSIDSFNGLASLCGWHIQIPLLLKIILPLGVSFYTFEAIGYMVDVYRGKAPAKNWLDYNFYIMYFPHLISGPIIRFCDLQPQYAKPLELPSLSRIAQGLELILLGYFFKVFIADSAVLLSDPVFQNPLQATSLTALLATLGFTVQIYFDFMGYTHIARGVSLLFNIELPLNFNHPYHASNISDFWNRWHISLSRWIRDYLFIPLGGSRGSLLKTVGVLLVTMLICGAWHGAGWTYILWGGYHGVLLSLYHLFKTFKQNWHPTLWTRLAENKLYAVSSQAVTFIAVILGWVLFRAPNFQTVAEIVKRLFNLKALLHELLHMHHLDPLFQLLALLTCCFIGPTLVRAVQKLYHPLSYWVKLQLASSLVILIWIFAANNYVTFIYFQF